MPRLSEGERCRIVGMLQGGASVSATARHFGVTRTTVRLWNQRYEATGMVADLQRSGRPRVTTPQQDRFIVVRHLRNRFQPSTVTARTIRGLRRITSNTVRNRLRERGLRARRPARRLTLIQHHRNARTAWARRYQRATNAELNTILWTDEVRFTLSRSDGRRRVYRRAGKRYANACVEEYESQGGEGVMAWGGISGTHRTQLVILNGAITGLRYRDEVVRPHIVPFLQQHGPGLTLQQDNARPHVARVVQDDLHARQIPTMLWPARSPDLSPIEHVWDEIKRRLHRRPHPPQTLQQLRQAVIEEWQNIAQAFIQRLVASVRQRCAAVLANHGGYTRY